MGLRITFGGDEWTYTYNIDGIRTGKSKANNSGTYSEEYVIVGGKIVAAKQNLTQQFISHSDSPEDKMLRYNKNNIKELKEYLYNSHVHDAKLKNIKYDCIEDIIKVELFNPIYDVEIALTFLNIGITLTIKGEWSENRETVISLTAEDDFSYLQNYLIKQSECMEDYLYLLFQMFSGDELHIVSKEVIIEITGE